MKVRNLNTLVRLIKKKIVQRKRKADIRAYIKSGRQPWARGYNLNKFNFIDNILANDDLMTRFAAFNHLPEYYGCYYDERVVEYPWVLSRLSSGNGTLLDAGSCFNFMEIIEHPKISEKDFTIFTLAPEGQAFWKKRISYVYGDLRKLYFRDNWFDEIISISTLGHVGMDCRIYDKN